MINVDHYTNQNKAGHNPKWPYNPDYPYRILINNQPDIDKIYLYAKDPYEAKYQYLIKKR